MAKKNIEVVRYSGFVLTFEPERTGWLVEKIGAGDDFSESFSALDWKFERRELFLLASRDPVAVFAVALMERGHGSGGSGKLKMKMTDVVVVDSPVNPDEFIIADLSSEICTAGELKRTEAVTWEALLLELSQLRPEAADAIGKLVLAREVERRLYGQSNRMDRLNEQRDGLGIALDIADIDRAGVLKSMIVENAGTANSVLDLIDAMPVHERSLLEHDAAVFRVVLGGESPKSASFADKSGRALRVYIADKTDLETVLGIDLIIYSSYYENFLLMQYKRMEKVSAGWACAIHPSSNIHDQLRCMASFRAAAKLVKIAGAASTLWSYRLNDEPFYFKFCEAFRPDARDDSLVRGITMAEHHFREFLTLPEAKGENGGTLVGYHNCPRYLNNTEFVQLARRGWIGASAKSISLLKSLLEANRRGGRTAMLAIIDAPKAKSTLTKGRKW
ncbi:MAG: hypothetical protein V4754_13125 [Pseudomonadota bacterium]